MIKQEEVWLVFGGITGWIGQMVVEYLRNERRNVVCAKSRMEDRNHLEKELDEVKPMFIVNCAGVTGRPNIDWCEDHKQETIRSNVIGILNLIDLASIRKIHVTNFATGCIYEYDKEHPIGGNNGFTEEDTPNFSGSFYSLTKSIVEKLIKCYSNVLTLRIRMPLSPDLHSRNFITKITKYEKVVNIPNSMSVLSELIPIAIDMTVRQLNGIYNFTNPGVISHNEILELYKKYIDHNFTWKNFTLEEQSKILKAGRSNNMLDTSKLLSEYPNIMPIHEATEKLFQTMAQKLEK